MGTAGCIFIKLVDWLRPVIDVKKVGQAIVDHVSSTGEQISRFACRFIPVDILCKAGKIEDFIKFATPVLSRTFPDESVSDETVTWCLEFKRRNNEKVSRAEIMDCGYKSIDTKRYLSLIHISEPTRPY